MDNKSTDKLKSVIMSAPFEIAKEENGSTTFDCFASERR